VSMCTTPPAGWACIRAAGHDGPCAAVEVIQADREAAADEAAHEHGTFRFCQMMRAGEYDGHHSVRAFARHRAICAKPASPVRGANAPDTQSLTLTRTGGIDDV